MKASRQKSLYNDIVPYFVVVQEAQLCRVVDLERYANEVEASYK